MGGRGPSWTRLNMSTGDRGPVQMEGVRAGALYRRGQGQDPVQEPLRVIRMTDMTENITFPKFFGGR